MNGTYPVAVYGWNHFTGDSPEMTDSGLPLTFADADLPTSVPDNQPGDSMETDLPYSPGLIEMPRAVPSVNAVTATASGNPTKPGLWAAVGNAVFGGTVQVSTTNSSASVASGANTSLNTGNVT